jgi:hypothetical protein
MYLFVVRSFLLIQLKFINKKNIVQKNYNVPNLKKNKYKAQSNDNRSFYLFLFYIFPVSSIDIIYTHSTIY